METGDRRRPRTAFLILVGLAGLTGAGGLALWEPEAPPAPPPRPLPRATPLPASPAGRDVGRLYCMCCHPQHIPFRETNMFRSLEEASPENLAGDLDRNNAIEYMGRRYEVRRTEGGVVASVTDGRESREFPVAYRIGQRFGQRLVVKQDRGLLSPFPAYWEFAGSRWRHGHETGLDSGADPNDPDDPFHWGGWQRSFNLACYDCHASRSRKNFDPESLEYDLTFLEGGVGCEMCHGPGGLHMDQNASGVPDIKKEARRTVARVMDLKGEQHTQVCAQCHVIKGFLKGGFEPGADFYDHFKIAVDPRMHFADGSPSTYLYQYIPFVQSACFHRGGATCTTCHDPHRREFEAQMKFDPRTDQACVQCHDASHYAAAAHTHHRPESEGARCVKCHMRRLPYRFAEHHDHLISVPAPEMTRLFGVPNACADCHQDRGQDWIEYSARTWYGDYQARRLPAVEAVSRAREGDTSVDGRLAELALDRSRPPMARAFVMAALIPLSTPRALETARRGLEDEHPVVRGQACLVLGRILKNPFMPREAVEGLTEALGLRLTDPTGSVRRLALGALASIPGNQILDTDAVRDILADLPHELALAGDDPVALLELIVILDRCRHHGRADELFARLLRIASTGRGLSFSLASAFYGYQMLDRARQLLFAPHPGGKAATIQGRLPSGLDPSREVRLGVFFEGSLGGSAMATGTAGVGEVRFSIAGVPPGDWRVVASQDLDHNGRVDFATDVVLVSPEVVRVAPGQSVEVSGFRRIDRIESPPAPGSPAPGPAQPGM